MRILLFILALNTTLIGQNQDSLKFKKWAVGLSFSPDYCFRIKQATTYTNNMSEHAKLYPNCGLNIQHSIGKKLGLELSILYSRKGEKITTDNYAWQTPGGTYDPAIPNSGQGSYITNNKKEITYMYHYLEMPLKLNWYVINKKFKLYASAGFSSNIFLNKKTIVWNVAPSGDLISSQVYYDKNEDKINFALISAIAISYDISSRLFIKLEPNYRQFIRPINDAPVSGYFYSIGCNTGLSYRF